MRFAVRFAVLFATLLLIFLSACSDDSSQEPIADATDGGSTDAGDIDAGDADVEAMQYSATIRYTSYGVPHVVADNYGDLMFGVGYAQAESHICTLADGYTKVGSRRAEFFGPGTDDVHINSDFAFLTLGLHELATETLPTLDPDLQDGIAGFAAGYNHYLVEAGVENLPSDCAGAAWIEPIDAVDVFAYALHLTLFSSALPFLDEIGSAQPPSSNKSGDIDEADMVMDAPAFNALELGSNGWGIGSDLTESGRGILVANPHFPWRGQLRFWENHQTVPGVVDVYGASLLGSPIVNIGFNEHLGWTHTVSASQRFTAYRVELDEEDPTRYAYGDETRDMTSSEHTIQVLRGGNLESVSRTMWHSHYGPMLNISGVGWGRSIALTYRDANHANTALASHWFEMGRSTNLDEFRATHRDQNGIPFVNTIYADAEGNAFYTDSTQVPNLSDETYARWLASVDSDPLVSAADGFGFTLLDGSDPRNEWVEAEGARRLGNIPPDEVPSLLRTDFVANANQSHWATNPAAPLEGFSPLYGGERIRLLPRTRTNLLYLTESSDDSYAGGDGLWALAEAEAMFFGGRTMLSGLLLASLIERCDGASADTLSASGSAENIEAACDALGGWDGLLRPDSEGVFVFREFLATFDSGDLTGQGAVFADEFDFADPVYSPNTPTTAPEDGADPWLEALDEAWSVLDEAGLAVDATLADGQVTPHADGFISVPGGNGTEGAFNIVAYVNSNATLLPGIERRGVVNSATDLTTEGYVTDYGSSFVMVVSWGDEGPEARAILTYSESGDPDSPHWEDQLSLFSEGTLRPVLFDEADIEADPNLRVVEVATAP